jgi:predicted nucleic acid-binding Zn ribbon protein
MVFREAICEGWKFNIAPAGRTSLRKPLAKLEFEWNNDGSLLAIHRFLSCPSGKTFFEPKRHSQAFCSAKCQKHHYYQHRNENFVAIRCAYCGNEFKPSRHGQTLCSENCQQKYWYRRNKRRKLETNANWQKKHPAKVVMWRHQNYLKRKKTIIALSTGRFEPGTGLNLTIRVINGQKRVVEAVRLERAITNCSNSNVRSINA